MFTLRVENFQSIQHAEIEVNGLTVITGPSNHGKSAMLRAVYGVFTNPRGVKQYVRYGKPHCSVEIAFGDGHRVLWEKGEKVNQYTLDGKPLKLVGQGVPPEVEALGVQPIPMSGDRKPLWPQFAHQFTGQVFLLDQPGSVLAEAISDVDRVGVLNEALRQTQSDHRSTTAERKVRAADIEKLEAQEKAFDGLDAVEAQLVDLELLDQQVTRQREALDHVQSLHRRHTASRTAVEALRSVRNVTVPTPGDRLARIDAAYQWLVTQRGKVQDAQRQRDLRRQESQRANTATIPETVDLTAKFKDIQDLRAVVSNVRALGDTLLKLRSALKTLETESAQADEDYKALRGQIQECPTCGALSLQEETCP